jgi:UDP:flavonoid glycosyltransferase YjiC (YdhE family)
MRTLVFAVAGYNLAETGRMIEIARAARKGFGVLFISYGGQFEELIQREGFTLRRMQPRLTEGKLAQLRKVLSGETWNTVGYLSARELAPRVVNEIELFEEIDPAAVLTGWCLSVTISTRAARVPFVNVLHSTSITEYYEAGLQTWPDRLAFPWLRSLVSDERLNKRINRRILTAAFPVRPYNTVGKRYGLSSFANFIELIEGDYTLLADIPEWVGLPHLRPNVRHVGPLPARIDVPIPKEIEELPRDRPTVYFAMGSSGKPKLVADIIDGFGGKPYRVVAPVRSLIDEMKVEVPPNVVVTGFLPAHRVNPMADVSVIHGGQNTVMNACLSGTPIVGMGMHPEQEANLEACVRKGFAVRLNKWRDKASDVLDAVDRMLLDEKAKAEAIGFRDQLVRWDGPANAATFLRETFGEGAGGEGTRARSGGR